MSHITKKCSEREKHPLPTREILKLPSAEFPYEFPSTFAFLIALLYYKFGSTLLHDLPSIVHHDFAYLNPKAKLRIDSL